MEDGREDGRYKAPQWCSDRCGVVFRQLGMVTRYQMEVGNGDEALSSRHALYSLLTSLDHSKARAIGQAQTCHTGANAVTHSYIATVDVTI